MTRSFRLKILPRTLQRVLNCLRGKPWFWLRSLVTSQICREFTVFATVHTGQRKKERFCLIYVVLYVLMQSEGRWQKYPFNPFNIMIVSNNITKDLNTILAYVMTIRTGLEQYIYIFDTHRTIIIVTSIVTNNRVFQKLPVFSSSVLEIF